MKRCNCCEQTLPLSSFYRMKKSPDGYGYTCRACGTVKTREAFRRNKAILRGIKIERGCAGCDERHPACLDFHHLDPSQKTFKLASPGAVSVGRLMREVEKCVILCANCHRKLHDEEGHVVIDDRVLVVA